MKPIQHFLNKPKYFWGSVRSLSQQIGYSKNDKIIVPDLDRMVRSLNGSTASSGAVTATAAWPMTPNTGSTGKALTRSPPTPGFGSVCQRPTTGAFSVS